MSGPRLLFLISLPRAGSTLLQRILAAHPGVATVDEPWLALPWIYALRGTGIRTEYGHATWLRALRGLDERVPDLRGRIERRVRALVSEIYSELAGEAPVFLDKTPRYHLIVPELAQLFPEARFILLFRNPADVWASSVRAFRGNRLRRMDHLDVDLERGPGHMAEADEVLAERAVAVRYEDLVSDPETSVREVCGKLGLDYDPAMVTDFATGAPAGLGDHRGIGTSDGIDDRRGSWREVIDSPVRKRRLLGYLDRVDELYLERGGYDRTALLREVRGQRMSRVRPDEWVWWLEEVLVRRVKDWVPAAGSS